MYDVKRASYRNEAPWEIPFERRIKRFRDMKQLGFRMVVYLYERADTSTFRYRVYNMCRVLESSAVWYGVYFFEEELEQIESLLPDISRLIIVRFRWTFELDAFVKKAKRNQIPIAFDVDDMIYNSRYLPLVTNTLAVDFKSEADYSYWFSYIGRIQKTAGLCDCAITTNEFIGKRLSDDLEISHYVVPNFYNREQDIVSDQYYRQKQRLQSSEKFVIGYFSGTPSHINDFLTVSAELKMLMEEFENIYLRIVGFMELPDYMRELEQAGRVERIPLQNFLDLQWEIAQVDVNIIPLLNNEFTNCKSELKYFEAAIVGTINCAVPTYVYKQLIQQGENGYLCEAGQWYPTLKELYQKGISREMIRAAKKISEERYAYYHMRPTLEHVLCAMETVK